MEVMEVMEVTEALANVTVCKYAKMTLLQFWKGVWDTCRLAANNGTTPEHGLKGKVIVRSKNFKQEVKPDLINFFKTVVLPLLGPHPTQATAEKSGTVIQDPEVTVELDLEWTKRWLLADIALI